MSEDRATTPTARPPVDEAFGPLLALLHAPGQAAMSEQEPQAVRDLFRSLATGDPSAPVRSSTDRTIPGPGREDGIPVRVVVPETDHPTGVLVWFHGGGWVIGDLDTADATVRAMAHQAGCVVVSVDYRLAPEHPAPAAGEDCWAATTWVAEHLDELGVPGGPVAVGGDSAGGNLAALVALRAVEEDGPELALQLLVYPATDLTGSHPSVEENGHGYFLTAETMTWFTDHYLSGGIDPRDPAVSPLFAWPDVVGRSAPARVIVAGYDPLRDEGIAYAEALDKAGVATELVEYPTMIHGFVGMQSVTPVAGEALAANAAALRAAFGA